jgi:signal transduction histidine kinase
MIFKNLLKKIKHYEQQKEILERTFYHDVLNTAVVVHGFARLLQKPEFEKADTYKKVLYLTSQQLIEEIETQRDISSAENDDLPVHPQQLNSMAILSEIVEQYKNHKLSNNRNLVLNEASHDIDIISDKTIIKRVLGNMVKNALEASRADETVTVGCIARGDEIEFQVHNPNYIPQDIQKRIFRFSFSTKGKGRGMGTYSMKLLSEKYLQGKISFHSSQEKGTTFTARYPLQYKQMRT